VLAGEEVIITRHGRPCQSSSIPTRSVLVRPIALAEAERLRNVLDRGRAVRLSEAPTVTVERGEELSARWQRLGLAGAPATSGDGRLRRRCVDLRHRPRSPDGPAHPSALPRRGHGDDGRGGGHRLGAPRPGAVDQAH